MNLEDFLKGAKPAESTQTATALPNGNYSIKIEKVEAKTNATTGNKGISLQMRVVGAKYNNFVLFDYMSMTGSEKAVEWGKGKLKKIGTLLGSEETDKWLGMLLSVAVGVQKEDATKNIVWGYSEHQADDNTAIMNSSEGAKITAKDLPF